MGKNGFNETQIEELRQNKNVKKVTETQIQFAKEFKGWLVEKHTQGEKRIQILKEAGILMGLLGTSRINNLLKRSQTQSQREEGFERKSGSGRPKNLTFASMQEELEYYKNQVEYLK